ncbi:MAG: mechanosensitive ion channel domain-containing protein, partial [Bacteriovoracaceae bacterium]
MNLEFFQSDRLEYLSLFLLKVSRLISFVLLALAYVSIVLGLFPWTKGWSDLLFASIFSPVRAVFKSILDYMPNLFFLIVLGVFVYYASSFLKFFFKEIERGKFQLAGFNREWADTTYKILRFLLIIFTTVVAFPYLPGANSDAFKGISIFLGVLFSLGSTSIVANIVAGIVLTYMLPFRVGDRVKIGETTG